MNLQERKQWFMDRIGKRVYRNNTHCCKHCQEVYANGIIITDEQHAQYLFDVETELYAEENSIHYFDTKEEVVEFEKQLEEEKK